MKKDKVNYLMVGLFVLASLLLLFYLLFQITGMQSGEDNYFVNFKNVTGIKQGSSVTYGGYKIGQIESIKPIFDKGKTQYQLKLNVQPDWKIPEDSIAEVAMSGIISDKQIEITEGNSNVFLQKGSLINSKKSIDIMMMANTLASDMSSLMNNVSDDVLLLLKKLNVSADQVASILSDENRDHLNRTFKNADDATAHMVVLSKDFNLIRIQLDVLINKSMTMLDDNEEGIRDTVVSLKSTMDVVSENLHSILYNLDASSRNMNEFTRQIRDNPSVILGSKPPVDESEQRQ